MRDTLRYILVLVILLVNTLLSSGQCDPKCYTTKHFERDTTIFISDTVLNIEKKWEYENVSLFSNVFSIDINHDDKAELVIAKAPENGSSFSNKLLIINSTTGRVEKEVVTPFFHSGRNGHLGPYILYDIDNDCIPEIIIATADDIVNTDDKRKRLVCLDLNGNILWISNEKYGRNLDVNNNIDGFVFVLADFNMDGISELVLLNEIFNIRTGVRLCHGGDNGMGLGGSFIHYSSSPVAANLDEDEYIELAAGYTVYKVRINNLEGEDGNTMFPINFSINGDLIDGSTAVSDINGDGRLDIIVNIGKRIKNRIGNVEYGQYIYTIQQDTAKLLSIAMNDLGNEFVPRYGNIACIGRLSEEDSLSIVVSFWMQDLRIYRYNGTDELELTSKILFVPTFGNNVTDPYITMYDLDGDGEKEIIAQNQKNLMILKVVNGKLVVINRTACEKSLFIRNLIIISTDSTKQARICTTCYDEANDRNYLTIFGPPEGKHWAPARNIWHQYGYNPLFINDDGTVPQRMHNPATYKNGKYNNFNVQESLLDEDGYYPVPASSLYGDIPCIGYDVDTDSYHVSFTVRNRADASATARINVPVAFYTGDPEQDGKLIGVYHTTASITAGENTGMLSYSFPASGLSSLWMVVNTDRYPMILGDSSYYSIDECDYTDNVFIAELPKIQRQQQEICAGDTVDFYGQQLSTAGQYHYKLRSATDCDSLITILDLTVTDKKDEAVTDIACDTYIWNGQTYDRSGDYEYHTLSISGCDSIVTLSLSINPSIQQTEVQTTCERYEWNGQTYTTSGIFTYNGQTSQGCDSTVTLNLTIHPKAATTQQISVCDSYEWNGQKYDQSGTYTYKGQTKYGCDSTAILELVVSTSLTVTEEKTACDEIIINGITLDTSGDYPESYLTSTGCDSTHILRLIINKSTQSNQAITACAQYDFFGSTITESGIFRHTLTNQQGCDSLITLDLRIAAEASQATATACGSYHWAAGDTTITNSGIYTARYLNQYGCDSTITLSLNITPEYDIQKQEEACGNYTWQVTKERYTATGIYSQLLKTAQGCDSLLTLDLTIHPEFEFHDTVSTTTPYYWPLNGQTYDQSGVYTELFRSEVSCDSLHVLHLRVNYSTDIYFPNIITGDGRNGFFTGYSTGEGIQIKTLSVFDRWGNRVFHKEHFEANEPEAGWNGKFGGKDVVQGVYIWTAQIVHRDGREETFSGDVTVVR